MSRRRCLTLFASAAVLPVAANAAPTRPATWTGQSMGGDVSIVLDGFSSGESDALTELALGELSRLEEIFSLYRPTSALSKLNRDGELSEPPQELVAALEDCRMLYERSGGAFDPTVQRMWEFYQQSSYPVVDDQRAAPRFAAALHSVGFDDVSVSPGKITLPKDASLTLNGIAQGIITDRVATLLRSAGAQNTLINLGEFKALGPKADGSPWTIGLRDPSAAWRLTASVPLVDCALATSAGSGYRFRDAHHLIDPSTGKSPQHFTSVTVGAPTAALADGLSTALYVLPLPRARALVRQHEDVAAQFTLADGRTFATDRWSDLFG